MHLQKMEIHINETIYNVGIIVVKVNLKYEISRIHMDLEFIYQYFCIFFFNKFGAKYEKVLNVIKK